LSSSGQVAPNFWLDPATGIQYLVAVMTPQYRIDSLGALRNTPVVPPLGREPQLIGNVARVTRSAGPTNVTHHALQPTFEVLAGVDGRDLGRVADDVERVLDRLRPTLPRGTTVTVRGQVATMNASFHGLESGILFAVVLVYLLMAVNFQSWT